MRALKVLVLVMGVLLIGGVVVLVATIGSRLGGRMGQEAATRGFGTVVVDVPSGTVLAGRDVVGNRLVLTLALPGGGHRLLVFEPQSGTLLGSLELRSP
jgi:hypothetical protein